MTLSSTPALPVARVAQESNRRLPYVFQQTDKALDLSKHRYDALRCDHGNGIGCINSAESRKAAQREIAAAPKAD